MERLATPITHDGPNLILSGLQLSCGLGLNENHYRARACECAARDIQAKILLIGCERNVDSVVTRDAKEFSQRLKHANNLVYVPTSPNVLPHNLIWRMIGEHVRDDIGPNDADLMRRVAFAVVPKTAHIQGHAIDVKHGDGGDPPNRNVIGFLIFMLDADRIVGSDTRAPTRGAQSEDGLHVIFGDVLTLVVLYEVLARGDDARPV